MSKLHWVADSNHSNIMLQTNQIMLLIWKMTIFHIPTMLYMTYCYFMHTVKYNAKCLFLQFGLPLCKHYFNEHSRRSGVSFVVT